MLSQAECRTVVHTLSLGPIGAEKLKPIVGAPTKRAFAAFRYAVETDLLIRKTGDITALRPPLNIERDLIDQLFRALRNVLTALDQTPTAASIDGVCSCK